MKLSDLKEINNNINIEEYLSLYNYVRDNMKHKEWLGTFSRNEIEEILNNGGKIWMYYDKEIPVCSIFYIPVKNKTLRKTHKPLALATVILTVLHALLIEFYNYKYRHK